MTCPFQPLPRRLLPALLLAGATTLPAFAQETVIPNENVRYDYAKVLRVEPVFQTLRATRMEQRCNGQVVPPKEPEPTGMSRIVGAVKEALHKDPAPVDKEPAGGSDCHMVPVVREFRRPIAYDVDYTYKGVKYRSRMGSDPGNRLKVRVSVTPYVAPREGD